LSIFSCNTVLAGLSNIFKALRSLRFKQFARNRKEPIVIFGEISAKSKATREEG
jgi:hypothetical protein